MSRRGFTLIEVTVALLVGGMVLSAAAALLSALGGRADAIRAAGARVDRDANFERVLRQLWENLRPGADSSTRTVSGDSSSVRFLTRCETVEGWLRPCSGRLAIEGGAARLELETASGQTVTLAGPHGVSRIRYLRDAANGGSWAAGWTEVVAPQAIALVVGVDTLLFPTW